MLYIRMNINNDEEVAQKVCEVLVTKFGSENVRITEEDTLVFDMVVTGDDMKNSVIDTITEDLSKFKGLEYSIEDLY